MDDGREVAWSQISVAAGQTGEAGRRESEAKELVLHAAFSAAGVFLTITTLVDIEVETSDIDADMVQQQQQASPQVPPAQSPPADARPQFSRRLLEMACVQTGALLISIYLCLLSYSFLATVERARSTAQRASPVLSTQVALAFPAQPELHPQHSPL
uniref:Uncharacterized protein n=1 Tax=Chromera velia CCMP2878 TaxID=1169474 RepID=A0A0G4FJB7_9ALVE|eukprot:Cvel_17339.t1-p1 / transcript=Cvel_17339.t1 / gene=Cvel_17339 / organism=Chromera_velia_CCMP2878 / gene_product=hypothetical protein / transcript_product=hypothetical protein / location=Cvel_scaffold1377:43339-44895(+) / protein_length=156 / sequence_SO=supercontig / SO=protein_coding / is_pseudo=false